MDMKICAYCGNMGEQDPCMSCGGSYRDARVKAQNREQRWSPYHHNGYMVWPSAVDDFEMILRYYFYLGEQLVETIQFPRQFIYRIEGYDNFNFNIREFVWKLFEIAQGEEEVLRLEERVAENRGILPATFEIRRIEPEILTEGEAVETWIERYQ